MEIENILKKVMESLGISLLLITNHAREVPKFHCHRPTAVIWLWEAFSLGTGFQIVIIIIIIIIMLYFRPIWPIGKHVYTIVH